MAKERGWWDLKITIDWDDLEDCDREHIAESIKQGYAGGEICDTMDPDSDEMEGE